MKKNILLLFIFIWSGGVAQFSNNIWCFGDSCGINWTNFNSPTNFVSSVVNRGGSVSILDTISGDFVYANSRSGQIGPNTKVWNRYNELMQNGTGLAGTAWYHELQLLPYPDHDSLMVLFGIGVVGNTPDGLLYSIINYKANNDSGIVTQKNIQLNNLPAVDALAAVKHGNGRDWWIIFQRWDNVNITPNNEYYIYLLSPTGVSGPFIQSIGSSHSTNGGCIRFNQNGSSFVNVNIRGLIELYDFDRCSGLITGTTPIEQEPPGIPYPNSYFSCEFSPDGSKLYVSNPVQSAGSISSLYQFDLNAANISASRVLIHPFDTDTVQLNDLKIAPDNKIYLTCFYVGPGATYPYNDSLYNMYNNNLSVINQPDSLGAACNFQPFSFNLGVGRTYYGLPNNADYEMGPLVGSGCDTITAVAEIKTEAPFFQAWYKSDWNTLFVNTTNLKGHQVHLRVFDSTGRLITQQKGTVYSGYFTADVTLNNLEAGVYIVQIATEKEKLSTKFVH